MIKGFGCVSGEEHLPGLGLLIRFIEVGDERSVETDPAAALLPKVHTEALLGQVTEPPHLEEVDPIRYGKEKFQDFYEERLKRFA